MTGMLASVSSLAEASLVWDAKVDIIDLKQPASGALGALDVDVVQQIVTAMNGQCPISATIGDLPMQPELVFNAVKAMAETGVNYIKIGFFPGDDWQGTVARLTALTQQNIALIAVLFADNAIDLTLIDQLKNACFKGVMLDTLDKNNGSLTQCMTKTEIARFVNEVQTRQLICGLAGSLRLKDIPGLLAFHPDYLGFRGALCRQQNRTAQLSRQAVDQVKQAIHFERRSL